MLVNYWEIRPSLMGARLDELLRQGVSSIATFVPWQAVESDITHTLARFLQVVADRKMEISLILTPEVGVHYANSGLPKDLFSSQENMARHHAGGAIPVGLPPNSFPLPSLSAPEFNKRYHNFLSRMDNLLADLSRTQPHLLDGVTLILTGSFWKYYRSARDSSTQAFGGLAGDFSGCSAVAYRQRLEQYFAQREFTEPNPAAANRWKHRTLEEVNRRWFNQQSEDVFRSRSTQFVRRKARQVRLKQLELYTPEADNSNSYSNFLQVLTGSNGDFSKLSQLVDEASSRSSIAGIEGQTAPFIHWTGLGGFRSLSDSEKQFLILKSLLLMGGRGGGVLIDEAEWFELSQSFRSRAEALARQLAHRELSLKDEALYLAPHLWSGAGTLWDELNRKVPGNARLVSSVDLVLRTRDAKVLVVDPSMILTREVVEKLTGWAKGGRVLVLPRSPLYSDAARNELEHLIQQSGVGMDIDLGISYRLHSVGSGKVILFNLPEGISMRGESLSAWQTFIASVLSVAGIGSNCSMSDGRLKVVPLAKKDGSMGLFILNGANRSVAADIFFPTEVSVSDLALSISGSPRKPDSSAVVPANRFALEVPPCGILPISVDGLGAELEDNRAAHATGEIMKSNALDAARSELPGLNPGEDIEATWS